MCVCVCVCVAMESSCSSDLLFSPIVSLCHDQPVEFEEEEGPAHHVSGPVSCDSGVRKSCDSSVRKSCDRGVRKSCDRSVIDRKLEGKSSILSHGPLLSPPSCSEGSSLTKSPITVMATDLGSDIFPTTDRPFSTSAPVTPTTPISRELMSSSPLGHTMTSGVNAVPTVTRGLTTPTTNGMTTPNAQRVASPRVTTPTSILSNSRQISSTPISQVGVVHCSPGGACTSTPRKYFSVRVSARQLKEIRSPYSTDTPSGVSRSGLYGGCRSPAKEGVAGVDDSLETDVIHTRKSKRKSDIKTTLSPGNSAPPTTAAYHVTSVKSPKTSPNIPAEICTSGPAPPTDTQGGVTSAPPTDTQGGVTSAPPTSKR